MKLKLQFTFLILAFLLCVQKGMAGVPVWLYTADDKTLTLVWSADNSVPNQTPSGKAITGSADVYANSSNHISKDTKAAIRDEAEYVVIDASMSNQTLTRFDLFFDGLKKVKRITGMEYLNVAIKGGTMNYTFRNCESLEAVDLTHLKTDNITSMISTFQGCKSLRSVSLSSSNTMKVTRMDNMFYGCSSLTEIHLQGQFNTANVTTMRNMFNGCSSLTELNLNKFNTANVTNMASMFQDCKALTKLEFPTTFTTDKVTDMSRMFQSCIALTSLDVSKFSTDKVTDMKYMFHDCRYVTKLDVSNFNTANVTNMANMFYNCWNLPTLDLPATFTTDKVTDMSKMFFNCYRVPTLNVSNFNTANVTNMASMFQDCLQLSTLDLPATFTTDKVTDMARMFQNCQSLTALDVSHFRTPNVTNMQNLFYNCVKVPVLDVSEFRTPNVTNMSGMFYNCQGVTELDVKEFNTANVTDMSKMFFYCLNVPTLDVSGFNTANVTSMESMFNSCRKVKALDVSHFNTAKVTDMSYMFEFCLELYSLNVSNFDTKLVEKMDYMFSNCSRLKTLTLNNFDGTSLKSATFFLRNAQNLEYLDMHAANNFDDDRNTEIASSTINPFTLRYVAHGSNITGQNIITTQDKANFVSADYFVADDTLHRYTDKAEYINFPTDDSQTAMKWEINIPHTFKAAKVTSTRKIGAKAGSSYTWYMPYDAPIPAGVEAYEFAESTVVGIIATFKKTTDTYLHAQKPYLVISSVGEVGTSVDEEATVLKYDPTPLGRDIAAAATSDDWKFIGSFQWRNTAQGAADNLYTLQTGNYWKHYRGSTAKPRPFRAFLQKQYPAEGGARVLTTQFEDNTSEITGVQKIELLNAEKPEESRIYDLNGRYLGTRREVLPSGTYIIGGKTTRVN